MEKTDNRMGNFIRGTHNPANSWPNSGISQSHFRGAQPPNLRFRKGTWVILVRGEDWAPVF